MKMFEVLRHYKSASCRTSLSKFLMLQSIHLKLLALKELVIYV